MNMLVVLMKGDWFFIESNCFRFYFFLRKGCKVVFSLFNEVN